MLTSKRHQIGFVWLNRHAISEEVCRDSVEAVLKREERVLDIVGPGEDYDIVGKLQTGAARI